MTADTPNNTQLLPPALENFLDRIISEKNFKTDSLPSDFITNAKNDLRPLLQKSINYGLFASLSPEKQTEFETLASNDSTTDDELQKFFNDNLADQPALIAEILVNFRNNYVGL